VATSTNNAGSKVIPLEVSRPHFTAAAAAQTGGVANFFAPPEAMRRRSRDEGGDRPGHGSVHRLWLKGGWADV
jgi:hypothetical protein